MALTPYSGDTSVIGKLGTTPQERGLTTQQFKDKFDEAFKKFIAEYFNTTHIDEINAHLAEDVHKLILGRIVPNGDLNQAITDGMYACNPSLANMPTPTYGTLIVTNSHNISYDGVNGYITQIVITAFGNTIYMRKRIDAGAWQPWFEIKTSKDIERGQGSPEGVISATVGTLYQRTDGGAGTTLYVKESGTGNTGWKAVQTSSGGTFTGIVKAQNNNSYTTAQIRNIILSPDEADAGLMGNGDIWIQYEEGGE